ncbi:MAG: GNAT family N-acetyltransferase [Acidimicrobiaceae bacterium]|nr:GNAT family N-acetyltransferase [Acidimicrobiaceae bacterium]
MKEASPRITRRPALPRDKSWAQKVHHDAYRTVVERQFGGWDDVQQDRFFENDWNGGQFEIIEWDGYACGFVCIEDRTEDVHVREIVIAPHFQRRGIGSAIIREAVEGARERRVPVVLGTFRLNQASALYQRLGFRETGRTETHTLFRLDP